MFDRTFVLASLFSMAFVSAHAISALLGAWIAPELNLPMDRLATLAPPDPSPLSAFLDRNLFRARRSTPIAPATCPKVDLGARVVATIIGRRDAIAWLAREGELDPIRVGDRIAGAEVIAIERGAIRISREGTCAELAPFEGAPRPPSSSIRRLSEHEVLVKRSDLESALSDPMRFARDARIVPKTNQGFALFSIKPSGIVDQLGFQNGDILHAIDGHRLDEPRTWLSPLELIERSEIQIDYTRNGTARTMTVRIE